ncbi:hypothetical protein MYX82_00090 [Acidobacteria bacterium AH-259-D05]|nr:hypothetical protein [Acidobacteria bacterium AH-259-D05]
MPQVFLSPFFFTGYSHQREGKSNAYAAEQGSPELLVQLMTAAAALGCDGCLCFYNDTLLAALRRTQQQYPQWAVCPIVPHVAEYSRAVTQYGMVGAALKRVSRLGIINLVRLGLFSVPRAISALRRDMHAVLLILVEAEMMAFARLRPAAVLLHDGVTDLASANNNAALINSFTRLVRTRYRTRPGLMTRNLGHTLTWVLEAELDVELIAAPANTKGWLMHPTQLECEQVIAEWKGRLFAFDPFCGGTVDLAEGLRYMTRHGFDGFTVAIGCQTDLSFLAEVIRSVRKSKE